MSKSRKMCTAVHKISVIWTPAPRLPPTPRDRHVIADKNHGDFLGKKDAQCQASQGEMEEVTDKAVGLGCWDVLTAQKRSGIITSSCFLLLYPDATKCYRNFPFGVSASDSHMMNPAAGIICERQTPNKCPDTIPWTFSGVQH